MRLAIVGSTSFNDYTFLKAWIRKLFPQIDVIISGGAPGADTLGEKYADDNSISKEIYYADWSVLKPGCRIGVNRYGKEYNKDAGFDRNTTIVEKSDVIVAFWNHKSPGTADTIKKAREAKKPVHIIRF